MLEIVQDELIKWMIKMFRWRRDKQNFILKIENKIQMGYWRENQMLKKGMIRIKKIAYWKGKIGNEKVKSNKGKIRDKTILDIEKDWSE